MDKKINDVSCVNFSNLKNNKTLYMNIISQYIQNFVNDIFCSKPSFRREVNFLKKYLKIPNLLQNLSYKRLYILKSVSMVKNSKPIL